MFPKFDSRALLSNRFSPRPAGAAAPGAAAAPEAELPEAEEAAEAEVDFAAPPAELIKIL